MKTWAKSLKKNRSSTDRRAVMSSQLPQKVIDLSRVVRDAGGRALLVGGCVRDELMGVPSTA